MEGEDKQPIHRGGLAFRNVTYSVADGSKQG